MPPKRPRLTWLWAVTAFLMVAILLGGTAIMRHDERTIRQEIENQLKAIAELKVSQIAQWRAERVGDAAILMESPFAGPALAGWITTGDPGEAARLLELFRSFVKHYGYEDILLVDAQGQVRLSWSGSLRPLEPEAAEVVAQALAEKRPILTDLHLAADGRTPHLGAVAPLFAAGERDTPIGAVILQIRADRFLYPLIQSWPVPSQTAETLLVRREGENVLFLNNLRHRPGWALALRIPLTRTEVPAVQAALGYEGFFEGRDYRDEPVIAFIKAVPDSPWSVVAKMDAREALAEWRFHAWALGGLTVGLLVVVGVAGALILQGNEVRHQRALARAEAALRQMEAGYRTTLLSVGDAVIVTDLSGRVTLMNGVAEALTGWSAAEAAGRPLGEVFHIINEETRTPVEDPVSRVLREGLVVGLGNHTLLIARDGREIPIADSGAPIRDEAGAMSGVVLVFRDQVAERTHLRRLTALNRLGQALAQSNDLGAVFGAVCDYLPQIADCPGLLISLYDEETHTLRAAYALADGEPLDVSAFPPLVMEEGAPLRGRQRAVMLQQPAIMEEMPTQPGEDVHFVGVLNEEHIPRSALYVPMVVEGRTVGLLEMQSYHPGAYTEAEAALLVPAANQIGLAIRNARLLASLQAERDALARERSLLRTVLDNLPGPVFVKDAEGRLQVSNRADCEANGWREEEVLGKTARELFPGEVGERTYQEDRHIVQTGQPVINREERFVAPTGEVRWFLISKIPFRDASGRIIGLVGISHDITALREATDALLQSEEEKSLILDNVSEWFLYLSPDLRVHLANRAAAASVNQRPRDLVGRYCYEIWHGRTEPCEGCPVLRARETGQVEEQETEFGERIYHSRTYPIFDEGGEVTAFVEFVRDVTRERQLERQRAALEAQLQQALKMEAIGRLAGGVAHDYNNMLQSILGYTQLALEETPEDHPLRMYLEEIQAAGQRSAALTRQLLAFARRQTIAPEVLDLNAHIEEMLKMLRRLIGEDIALQWLPAPNALHVFMDPSQIDQILANLVVNARDAISGVGTIIIETGKATLDEAYAATHAEAAPGHYVVLAINDTGTGMTDEVKAHLFEPFFTTKAPGQGTGLGLATVYGIVKQNGGFINVYSEVGRGTTFRIYLPSYEAAERPAEAEAAPRALPMGQETILFVEDEMTLLEVGGRMLERLGYTVLGANSPDEALRLAQDYEGEIHLLITDVVMPAMNGRQLAERVQALRPGIKCLYTSGYTANVISHAGVLEEGLHFIQKPFSLEVLAAKVREALGG